MLMFEKKQKALRAAQYALAGHMRPLCMRPLLYMDYLYEASQRSPAF